MLLQIFYIKLKNKKDAKNARKLFNLEYHMGAEIFTFHAIFG
jgi:hypothetical protein